MAQTPNQKKVAIVAYFQKRYVDWSGGQKHMVNMNREKWAAGDLIDSYGYDQVIKMIDYYYDHSITKSWRNFCNKAQAVYDNMESDAADAEARRVMKQRAKDWNEWNRG